MPKTKPKTRKGLEKAKALGRGRADIIPQQAQHSQIRILCADQRSNELFDLGPGPIKFVDGFGGFEEVTIPGRKKATDYQGANNLQLEIKLMLDGYPHNDSQEGKFERLLRLARDFDDGQEPPVIQVFGAAMPPATSGRHYQITSVEFDDDDNTILNPGGTRVRQPVTIKITEFNNANTPKILKQHSQKKHQATGGTQVPPSHYTVKDSDTLFSIALKFYGDRSKWKDIADANGIRDPRNIKAGTKIKLP